MFANGLKTCTDGIITAIAPPRIQQGRYPDRDNEAVRAAEAGPEDLEARPPEEDRTGAEHLAAAVDEAGLVDSFRSCVAAPGTIRRRSFEYPPVTAITDPRCASAMLDSESSANPLRVERTL